MRTAGTVARAPCYYITVTQSRTSLHLNMPLKHMVLKCKNLTESLNHGAHAPGIPTPLAAVCTSTHRWVSLDDRPRCRGRAQKTPGLQAIAFVTQRAVAEHQPLCPQGWWEATTYKGQGWQVPRPQGLASFVLSVSVRSAICCLRDLWPGGDE